MDVDIERLSTGERESMLWDVNSPCSLARRNNEHAPTIFTIRPELQERDLLILADQGIGDIVQQWRYVPQLAAQFGRVRVQCRPELHRLLRQQGLPAELVSAEQARAEPAKVQVSLMRMGALDPDPTGGQPYLKIVDPAPAARGSERRRLRVGLNWSARSAGAASELRSVPLALFEGPVRAHPEISWVSLQWGSAGDELREYAWADVIEPLREIADVADLACAIAELDLLVSIDSAPAHIAGALGVPVWNLLSRPCSWRWGLDAATTPLYRDMRLLRQQRQGEWDAVIGQFESLLDRLGEASSPLDLAFEPPQRAAQPGARQPVPDAGARLDAPVPSAWNDAARQSGGMRLEDALRMCRQQPGLRTAFVSAPMELLASLGIEVSGEDYEGLAEIFKAMVDCHGGFSWCTPLFRDDTLHGWAGNDAAS
ncbi:hypothetical protein CEY11_09815 [Candidimonas nitroreducens]|uniref:ADP-heptose--LPS heptosyltransferase n=1 Tax=Candidimonas nitroreducens TaxID=683354 RepID=A0A225MLJ8_9BURK|nr:hypothetical protein CEY11_09815 [Candidimonas nitroreducens]